MTQSPRNLWSVSSSGTGRTDGDGWPRNPCWRDISYRHMGQKLNSSQVQMCHISLSSVDPTLLSLQYLSLSDKTTRFIRRNLALSLWCWWTQLIVQSCYGSRYRYITAFNQHKLSIQILWAPNEKKNMTKVCKMISSSKLNSLLFASSCSKSLQEYGRSKSQSSLVNGQWSTIMTVHFTFHFHGLIRQTSDSVRLPSL